MDAINSILTPLKPTLQTITHNLPSPLYTLAFSLLGDKCTTTLLHDLDLSSRNLPCLSLAISKAIGIAIIAASSVVKIPQLVKLLRSQSSTGLSFPSYLLETASFLITLAYNVRSGFPFSTFGETALIAVQDVAIAALILVYSGQGTSAAAFVAAVGAASYALLGPTQIVSSELLGYLQAGAGVLSVASKVPQIYTIWSEGTTGQLSAFAVFNYLIGSLMRIFTTLQEVDDSLILYGFVTGFALNAVLAAQMLYYWNAAGPSSSSSASATRARKEALSHIERKAVDGEKGAKRAEALEHVKRNVGVSGGSNAGGSASGVERKGPSTRRRG